MGPLMGICDEFRHTRGEWVQGNIASISGDRAVYAEVGRMEDIALVRGGGPEETANANLIAAAPEILAALCDWYDFHDDPNFPQRRLVAQTEEAIGQAKDWE